MTKMQITVSQACRFLELRDYPLPVTEDTRPFLSQLENFERLYLPLVASVNPGASLLALRTLARAKWLAMQGGKPTTNGSYFSKPRSNRVRLSM